jgi:hypothetical protein
MRKSSGRVVGTIGLASAAAMAAVASGAFSTTAGAAADPASAAAPATATPTQGYWEAAADGGVFTFGTAAFYGSMGGQQLNAPVVGVSGTQDGLGYWLVASDGGVFSFGDAQFYGSMGGQPLNAPVVGIATDTATGGYWLNAQDGGVFAFNAPFLGSEGGIPTNPSSQYFTGISGTVDGGGYWQVFGAGVVIPYGDATDIGPETTLPSTAVGITRTSGSQAGFWLATVDGSVYAFGNAVDEGSMGGLPLNAPIVGISSSSAAV